MVLEHSIPGVLAHAMILAHGDVAAGADAVATFHSQLGLGPISAAAHTTLEAAVPAVSASVDELAASLRDHAARELAAIAVANETS